MTTWREDANEEIFRRVNQGENRDDVIADVMAKYQPQIMLQAQIDAQAKLKRAMYRKWLEPDFEVQLSFSFSGKEWRIPDDPVRIVGPDGKATQIPAMHSTAEQRQASNELRVRRLQSLIRRSEAEQARDLRQSAEMLDAGLDLSLTWAAIQHQINGTKCWRCGDSVRPDDPFERGHSDAPASQGGTVTEWEHQSCNRSARANPVARPMVDDHA